MVVGVALDPGVVLSIDHPQSSHWIVRRQLGQGGHGRVFSVKRQIENRTGAGEAPSHERMVMKVGLRTSKHMQKELVFYKNVATKDRIREWRRRHELRHLALPRMAGYSESMKFEGITADLHIGILLPRICSSASQLFRGGCDSKNDPMSYLLLAKMGKDILNALEFIHYHRYTHNDLKPSNILLEPDQSVYPPARFYLVDFGITYPYTYREKIEEGATTPHYGTTEYCSLDSHRGLLPAPRGDLGGLFFTLLKCCCGVLPWTSIRQDRAATFAAKSHLIEQQGDEPLGAGLINEAFECMQINRKAASEHSDTESRTNYDQTPNPPVFMQLIASSIFSLQYNDTPSYKGLREQMNQKNETDSEDNSEDNSEDEDVDDEDDITTNAGSFSNQESLQLCNDASPHSNGAMESGRRSAGDKASYRHRQPSTSSRKSARASSRATARGY